MKQTSFSAVFLLLVVFTNFYACSAKEEGKQKGLENGRMLLPPMPWQNYAHMKDEDVQAVFAYLKSIPPVSNLVPTPTPPVK